MKKNDLAIIMVAVILSAFVSILASKFLFSPANRQQSVEVVPVISASFPKQLDQQYFNQQSIDPTQFISIGNNTNPNPFSNQTPGH